jgi:hypothetical protein
MLAMLESAAGTASFAEWVKKSEAFIASKSEKLDFYFKPLYSLLEDLVLIHGGAAPRRNADIAARLSGLAARVDFAWLREAVEQVDGLTHLQRRNVQKGPSVDRLVVSLRQA